MPSLPTPARVLVPLSISLAACGEPAEPPLVGPGLEPLLVRLELVAAGELPSREAASLEVVGLPGLEQRIQAPGGELETGEVRRLEALQLVEGDRMRLLGPFPDDLDRLLLETCTPGGGELSVKGFSLGGELGTSKVTLPPGSARWRTVQVPMAWMHGAQHRPTFFMLRFSGTRGPPALREVEFRGASPESWLPDPSSPELVSLGTDARRAVGISTRAALETTVDPAPESQLTFGFALAPDLNPPGGRPRLRVSLVRDGEQFLERTFRFARDGWERRSVPLDGSGSRPITARFELLGRGRRPAVALLEQPAIERRLEAPRTVVLVTSDTHRADHVGVAGRGVEVQTPFLDSLARRGVLFEDCQSTVNITNPSHISLMTGQSVRDHGVVGLDVPLGVGAPLLAEAFAAEGWATYAAVSVVHLGPQWSGLGRGFDRFSVPEKGQRDSSETIAVLEGWLDEERDTPLFVWLHVFDAHGAYAPPKKFSSLYWPEDSDTDPFDPTRKREGWRAPHWGKRITDPEYVLSLYKGEISYLDARLGALFERPRLGGALIAFVADHGEHMFGPAVNTGRMSGPTDFCHDGLAPGTLDVPLLIAGPGVPHGSRIARPVTHSDLGRTLLDLAGLGHRALEGTNLLLESAARPTRFAISGHAASASVRRGRWMLIQKLYSWAKGKPQVDHTVSLFDLERDAELQHDLAGEQRALACELRIELVRWLTAEGGGQTASGPRRDDADTQSQLAQLGYATSSALPQENPWLDPECDCEPCVRFPLAPE